MKYFTLIALACSIIVLHASNNQTRLQQMNQQLHNMHQTDQQRWTNMSAHMALQQAQITNSVATIPHNASSDIKIAVFHYNATLSMKPRSK